MAQMAQRRCLVSLRWGEQWGTELASLIPATSGLIPAQSQLLRQPAASPVQGRKGWRAGGTEPCFSRAWECFGYKQAVGTGSFSAVSSTVLLELPCRSGGKPKYRGKEQENDPKCWKSRDCWAQGEASPPLPVSHRRWMGTGLGICLALQGGSPGALLPVPSGMPRRAHAAHAARTRCRLVLGCLASPGWSRQSRSVSRSGEGEQGARSAAVWSGLLGAGTGEPPAAPCGSLVPPERRQSRAAASEALPARCPPSRAPAPLRSAPAASGARSAPRGVMTRGMPVLPNSASSPTPPNPPPRAGADRSPPVLRLLFLSATLG